MTISKDRMMQGMQRFGGAMYTPVILFAFFGLTVALSIICKNEGILGSIAAQGTVWYDFWYVVEQGAWTVFAQMPILFAIAVPIGFAKKEQARCAMEGFVIYMLFNYFIAGFLSLHGAYFGVDYSQDAGAGTGLAMIANIKTLDMGMLGAIFIACMTAYLHNRFYDTNIPDWLGIFKGPAFVVAVGFAVMIPIADDRGRVVGFGGRVLDSRTKGVSIKYQNSPESVIYSKKRELYGLFFAKKAIVKEDLCYLVEGYTDVMAMHQQGVENVVASSGTALTHEQIRLIHRFTENITVIYDGDAAGIKASQRGIDMLLAEGMTVRLLLLPDGDDPDSFARKHTATEYQQYLAEHQVDFIRFKTDLLLNEAKGDPIKLSRLVNNIVDSLAVIPDEITRTFYIKETSQMLAIEERIITTAVAKVRAKMREERNKEREREANRQQTTPDLAHPQQRSSASVTQDGLTFSQPVDSFATREGRGEADAQPGATPERPTPNPSRNGGEQAGAEMANENESLPLRGDLEGSFLPRGDLEGSFPFGRGGSAPEEEKILRTEALLVQMLIRHGEKVMCDVEDEETGEARPLKVAEFISFSLDQDSLHLHHPLHQRILQETLEHLNEEGFHCTRYFENHPDNDVATLAISLAHDPEALSKVHSKGLTIPPEEERLAELVPRLMTDYKLAIVKKAINGLRRQLADPAIKADKDHFTQLMQEFISTTQSLKELSKECGDRVIS